MREIILNRIIVLQKEKQDKKTLPASPNEFELKKDILEIFNKELDSLIEDESITVIGATGNKHRILKHGNIKE